MLESFGLMSRIAMASNRDSFRELKLKYHHHYHHHVLGLVPELSFGTHLPSVHRTRVFRD
jgi:hypothetical protein